MDPGPGMLSPAAHPFLTGSLVVALALYGAALFAAAARASFARGILAGAVGLHLVAMVARGIIIGFFPLTTKAESFMTMALSLGIITLVTWRPDRRYLVPMLLALLAFMVVGLRFPLDLAYPAALMRTIWYPLHVPAAFLAYGLWVAAAAAAIPAFRDGDRDWSARVDRYALQGFGLWSLGMVCGGVWGVLAWGAYFLWDPKVIWSVVLWFHYATFIHLRWTPSLQRREWVRPVMAWIGVLWVLVAYVGTSFFFGRSSHAF